MAVGSSGPRDLRHPLRAAGKAHEALQHLNNGNESPGGWHISAMPGQDHNRAAKMGRREAWARFLAYDVSLASSICIHCLRSFILTDRMLLIA